MTILNLRTAILFVATVLLLSIFSAAQDLCELKEACFALNHSVDKKDYNLIKHFVEKVGRDLNLRSETPYLDTYFITSPPCYLPEA